MPIAVAGDHDAIADALQAQGICLIDGWPSPAAATALRDELLRLHRQGALHAAAVGRGADRALREDIRGDRALWLDDPRCEPGAARHLEALATLRIALNQRLFLGLQSVEAHYAVYPPGMGYARHRDRFRHSDARVLSLVSYLNPGWSPADGGALRVHVEAGALDIAPLAGTSVCFLSELEHEVLPATRERLSVAAWMRRDAQGTSEQRSLSSRA